MERIWNRLVVLFVVLVFFSVAPHSAEGTGRGDVPVPVNLGKSDGICPKSAAGGPCGDCAGPGEACGGSKVCCSRCIKQEGVVIKTTDLTTHEETVAVDGCGQPKYSKTILCDHYQKKIPDPGQKLVCGKKGICEVQIDAQCEQPDLKQPACLQPSQGDLPLCCKKGEYCHSTPPNFASSLGSNVCSACPDSKQVHCPTTDCKTKDTILSSVTLQSIGISPFQFGWFAPHGFSGYQSVPMEAQKAGHSAGTCIIPGETGPRAKDGSVVGIIYKNGSPLTMPPIGLSGSGVPSSTLKEYRIVVGQCCDGDQMNAPSFDSWYSTMDTATATYLRYYDSDTDDFVTYAKVFGNNKVETRKILVCGQSSFSFEDLGF
jgi:hypothetical protein